MALLKGWRELLLTRQVPVSRSLLRKLLDQSRFVFYPKADDRERWYELGVTPSLQKFFEAVPAFSKTMASPTGRDPFLYRGFVGRRAAYAGILARPPGRAATMRVSDGGAHPAAATARYAPARSRNNWRSMHCRVVKCCDRACGPGGPGGPGTPCGPRAD
jgi:hypothetical protein